ncbi:hypothetical protein EVAR_32472_1 [Eumeta japonica]|uniref:Uncharacterized protein n=1 Tax=Eumeta variegata TaxID=151549 RepID=A0A4C1VKA7_EUMVA|nr:hypothetical protein EVAR_32472_1 [Eumeta japonica]
MAPKVRSRITAAARLHFSSELNYTHFKGTFRYSFRASAPAARAPFAPSDESCKRRVTLKQSRRPRYAAATTSAGVPAAAFARP